MSTAEHVSVVGDPANESTEITRVVISSIIGTAVEWYDFLIYATASALVFNKLFFPLSDPALGTIAAFGAYGVGFLARPLDAAIFGHFGSASFRPTIRLASPLRFCWSYFACCRASASVANGAEPC